MNRGNGTGGPDQFKRAPRRKKQPVTKGVLSPEERSRYEEMSKERDQRQKQYEGHLPGDKAK